MVLTLEMELRAPAAEAAVEAAVMGQVAAMEELAVPAVSMAAAEAAEAGHQAALSVLAAQAVLALLSSPIRLRLQEDQHLIQYPKLQYMQTGGQAGALCLRQPFYRFRRRLRRRSAGINRLRLTHLGYRQLRHL